MDNGVKWPNLKLCGAREYLTTNCQSFHPMQRNPGGPRIPDPSPWIPDSGSRIVDPGYRVVDSSFQTHGFHWNGPGFHRNPWILDSIQSEFRIPRSGFRIPKRHICWIPDSIFLHVGESFLQTTTPFTPIIFLIYTFHAKRLCTIAKWLKQRKVVFNKKNLSRSLRSLPCLSSLLFSGRIAIRQQPFRRSKAGEDRYGQIVLLEWFQSSVERNKRITLVLHNFTQWLVQSSRATFSTNQK